MPKKGCTTCRYWNEDAMCTCATYPEWVTDFANAPMPMFPNEGETCATWEKKDGQEEA